MLRRQESPERKMIRRRIAILKVRMSQDGVTHDEFLRMAQRIEVLSSMLENPVLKKLDFNTLLSVVGNLSGIAMILNYERLDVITSKAVSFIIRGRV
jgi:hypothetical protein